MPISFQNQTKNPSQSKSGPPKAKLVKKLIIRLSSLGDVILASAALEVESLHSSPSGGGCHLDVLVSKEYIELLNGHPKVHHLLSFDRHVGFLGWIRFCRELWSTGYDEVYDLHRSLRTRMMFALFFYWGLFEKTRRPRWKTISKQRLKLIPYYFFKGAWPKVWRPTRWVERYSRLVGGKGTERPNLRYLCEASQTEPGQIQIPTHALENYICVMPSSRWISKTWPIQSYIELLRELPHYVVVL